MVNEGPYTRSMALLTMLRNAKAAIVATHQHRGRHSPCLPASKRVLLFQLVLKCAVPVRRTGCTAVDVRCLASNDEQSVQL